jgi:hypothetical protein
MIEINDRSYAILSNGPLPENSIYLWNGLLLLSLYEVFFSKRLVPIKYVYDIYLKQSSDPLYILYLKQIDNYL